MDKKQLMDAFFANEKPDRVPVGFWHHFVSFHDHYGYEDPAVYNAVVTGQKKFIDEVDPDFLKIMSDGFFGHPSVCKKTVRTAEDLAEIKAVGPDHPWITRQVEYVKDICDYAGDGMYKLYNVFSPLQYIRLRFEEFDEDFKKFTALFRQNTDIMVHAAREIARDVNCLVDRLFEETSVDGIYYSVQSVQDKFTFNRDRHDKVVRPLDLAVLDNIDAHAKRNMIHICGYFGYTNDLSWYVDYPVQAFNWAVYSEHISLAEGKKIFDGKPVLGGFDNRPNTLLYTGSDEDIRREVCRILDEAGTTGVGLGADCTIGDGVPVARLELIRKIAEDYRR
ncbi:MAG: uroporphyrinogen decarboxylase [Clostridia bacterium]|nr:uroporphyrinogen decarboxylase [Clostridia bacterium]